MREGKADKAEQGRERRERERERGGGGGGGTYAKRLVH